MSIKIKLRRPLVSMQNFSSRQIEIALNNNGIENNYKNHTIYANFCYSFDLGTPFY